MKTPLTSDLLLCYRILFFGLVASLFGAELISAGAADWHPAKAPLMTRWAMDVSPENVHGEYPRPQLVRKDWLNLNGLWDYAIVPQNAAQPASFDGKILVPFPVESALSGVKKPLGETDRLWYRRSFAIPKSWTGKRVLLHFDAVDWEAKVWLNGRELGAHRGGYDGFSFDITDAMKAVGENELVVSVFDPTDAGTQPHGKQVRQPRGIRYTASSGIWQTVWLEPVAACHVEELKIVPDLDDASVAVDVRAAQFNAQKLELQIEALDSGRVVQTAKAEREKSATLDREQDFKTVLKIPRVKPWSPDSPFLYDLRVAVFADGKKVDEVKSYFGMRKISLGKDERGFTRLLLNNQPLFQFGPLDQGFWPDGLYTTPTDEALRYDIEMTKKLGFNLARKHVKVEPDRWYYWCDKLGLLVWQDMPSGDKSVRKNEPDLARSPESAAEYEQEWTSIIHERFNHPCIVMWVPFNEGWGQFETARIVELTRQRDPTRLVDDASGWNDRGVGDVNDMHNYPGPASPKPEANRAVVLGEFGGLGLPIHGHTWQSEKNFGYRSFTNSASLTRAYLKLIERLRPLVGTHGLSAAVYTQTTDVEGEVNGLMTYDRALVKMDAAAISAANKELQLPPPPPPVRKFLSPTSQQNGIEWRFTTAKPGTNWMKNDFDDSGWKKSSGGFGTAGTPGAVVRTTWNTSDIWLRRNFDAPGKPDNLQLLLHHDEDAEVFINGVPATQAGGYTKDYEELPVRREAVAALQASGNVLAVHCHQTTGGQFIDVGLTTEEIGRETSARWPADRAWQWYSRQPWLCGFNYVPANSISYTEMWMGDVFNPQLIDGELALAQRAGFNCCRVVLSFVDWQAEPDAFKQRFASFLSICAKRGIKVMPCFFDDCVFGPITDPQFGKQPEVVPGWYANGWTPSPGHKLVRDPQARPALEHYVKDIMARFREDSRILCWDLYNEPGNSGLGNDSLPLLKDVFAWARAVKPSQPVTSGIWGGNAAIIDFIQAESDLISFHSYRPASDLQDEILKLKQLGRPLICSEWMNRPAGSTVESCLPVFFEQRVGALNWGLVNGKTQTHLPWGHRPGDTEPKVWQHDLLRPDQSPYVRNELDLFEKYIQLSAKHNHQQDSLPRR